MPSKLEIIKSRLIRYRREYLPRQIRRWKVRSRHPFAVPVITFGALIILCGLIYAVASRTDKLPTANSAKIVVISHDRTQQVVPSKEATVGKLLAKLNIKLAPGDVVEPAANARIDQDQFRINVYRAVPVQIVDGQHRVRGFSAAKTARSVAQQVGANLYPEDRVSVEPSQDFLNNGTIGKQVVVDRATPVNVDLYGTPVVLRRTG
jgi:uncharacterized protein YabE (DUF348 family)